MEKFDVQIALEGVAEARVQWLKAQREFNEGCGKVLAFLLHEGVRNHMSVGEFAAASGLTRTQVRSLMRRHNMNPKDGKRLLSDQAAKALRENASLMGIKPHEMDLTSPLAYLPMGDDLRRSLQEETVSKVTEFPETEPDLCLPHSERRCQCKVPVSLGSLNGGIEVCSWCSYIIEPA